MEIKTYGSITITKVEDGANFRTFTTNYEYTQKQLDDYANSTSVLWWDVNEDTSSLKTGDSIMLRCYNTTKKGYSYIMAIVDHLSSNTRIHTKSVGLLDKGDIGETGRGTDEEITLYYAVQSTSGKPETPPTPDIQPESASYWVEKIPSQWKEEWYGKDTYIFKTVKKIWNDGDVTYESPTLMSQLEAATMAALDSEMSLADWCVANDVTVINGSTIATGTINADRLDADSLKVNEDFQVVITQPVKDLEIGGRNLIKLSQLTAVNCTIDAKSTNEINVSSVSSGNMALMRLGGNYEAGEYILNATGGKSGKDFRILFDKNYDGACTYNSYYEGHGYPYFKDYATMPLKLTFTEATSIGFVMKSDVGAQTITGLKLEKGNNNATDWSPAPEDMATAVELKVTNDKISTKVESSTYNSKMEQIDSAISTKVESSTYNSKMEQLDSAISAKVESSTYNSKMEQLDSAISAKVSSVGNNGEGFGWSLDNDGFYLKQYTDETPDGEDVFSVDKNGNASMNSGTIGGWDITEDGIEKKDADGNSIVGMHSGDVGYTSLVDGGTSPIRFYAGNSFQTKTVTVTETTTSSRQTFIYSPVDCKRILSATYSYSHGGGGGNFSGIDTDTLTFTWSGSVDATLTITYTYEPLVPFVVLEDGSLYANAAKITGDSVFEGTVYATGGEFTGIITSSLFKSGVGTLGNGASVFLSANNMPGTLTGPNKTANDWRLTVGSKFGVTSDGSLYASAANISGVLMAGAGSSIGAWKIEDAYIEGTVSVTNGTCKVQLSPMGVKSWTPLADGTLSEEPNDWISWDDMCLQVWYLWKTYGPVSNPTRPKWW